jgi:hypothetical protein
MGATGRPMPRRTGYRKKDDGGTLGSTDVFSLIATNFSCNQ